MTKLTLSGSAPQFEYLCGYKDVTEIETINLRKSLQRLRFRDGLVTDSAFQRLHSEALLSVHNITSLLAMVRADLGVTILPEMTLQTVDGSEFAFLALPDSPPPRRIHILRNGEAPASPAARELEKQIFATVSEIQSEKF